MPGQVASRDLPVLPDCKAWAGIRGPAKPNSPSRMLRAHLCDRVLATAEMRSQHVGVMRASLLSAHAEGVNATSVTNMHHEKAYDVILADSLLAKARPGDDSSCDGSDPWILSREPRIFQNLHESGAYVWFRSWAAQKEQILLVKNLCSRQG